MCSVPCVAADPQPPAAPTILIMGDSLSAGFGMAVASGWASLLQQRLAAEHLPHRVVNASISGETTSGGLSRLPQALQTHQPEIVIIELGANDGLRGLPLGLIENNLARMIEQCRQANAKVLLLGMRLPPNYGPRYTQEFTQVFVGLAERHNTALVPFLLTDVATRPELMQNDGLHPNASAQQQLLDTLWPQLLRLLTRRAQ
ncbi:MAG: arylesterase [Gammaproteobacteria bacterium]|nr:arylesterase [Gammaproteobacteria bacterium]